MDEIDQRRSNAGLGASGESEPESKGLYDLPKQLIGAYAGVRELQPSTWNTSTSSKKGETETERIIEPSVEEDDSPGSLSFRILLLAAGIFLLSALPRLYVLFFMTDLNNPGVGWYNDVFHHWQIGYLSKEIGFSNGFLRLWDLKGMEFFWGLLDPLMLTVLFGVTGSTDIVILRLLGLVSGGVAVTAFFFLIKRYFTTQVALATALLVATNPVAVFADSSGMQGPMATSITMIGLLLWPRRPLWAGVALAIAGMARAEYWVFGAGLVFLSFFSDESGDRKIAVALGWLVPSLAYMRYMTSYTGNPIYPVYWNFMGNSVGTWTGEVPIVSVPLSNAETAARWIWRLALIPISLLAYSILRKRRPSFLFLMYGVGNIMFLSLYWSFTRAVYGWGERGIYDRIFIVPHMYLALIISLLLMGILQRKETNRLRRAIGWAGIAILTVSSQMAYRPIMRFYEEGAWELEAEEVVAEAVASVYEGGSIAMPEDRPSLTYLLAHDFGISAQHFTSQMYDPFAYIDGGDAFANWTANRESMAEWFRKLDIRLIVYYSGKQHYTEMIRREPNWFNYVGTYYGGQILVYEVRGF